MPLHFLLIFLLPAALFSRAEKDLIHYPGEKYFANVRQLTFGGSNAEGYFSFDDKKLTFQASLPGSTNCDQIYQLDLTKDFKTQSPKRMSTGLGVTTCSYFMEDNEHFLYAGTFHKINMTAKLPTDQWDTCPPKKCKQSVIADPLLKKLCQTSYTWDVYPEFDIFLADRYGNIMSRLTDDEGYDAEGVVSPDGKLIAYTSMRGGDLDLWIMNVDGSNKTQKAFTHYAKPQQLSFSGQFNMRVEITKTIGYEGGSFFSPDGKRLIFRASTPKTKEEIEKYKKLLAYNLVAPTEMELFRVDIDGSNLQQITKLGGANWAPYYLHDNRRVIFSSDFNSTADFGAFNLYVINDDGTDLDQVTYDGDEFDSFPMMSYSGKQLVWGSSRNGSSQYEMNLFLADWVDTSASNSLYSFIIGLISLFTAYLMN